MKGVLASISKSLSVALDDPRRWCTLRLGEEKHQLQIPTGRDSWKATYSFLVYDLTTDTVRVLFGAPKRYCLSCNSK